MGSTAHTLLHSSPPLESRCGRWVRFEKQPPADLVPFLRSYHPLFAAMSTKAMLRIDEQWAHGNFRDWAKFLEASLRVTRTPARGLTDAEIGLAYDLINRPSGRG